MTIGRLGMALKAESDDPRASLSYKFKKVLAAWRGSPDHRSFVTTDPELMPLDEVIARSDLLILCTPHRIYKTADLKGKPVVDVWGFLANADAISLKWFGDVCDRLLLSTVASQASNNDASSSTSSFLSTMRRQYRFAR